MMPNTRRRSNRIRLGWIGTSVAAVAWLLLGDGVSLRGHQAGPAGARRPANTYWVYAGAESADFLHRIRFGPGGLVVEQTTTIGELPNEMEGPHGLAISADGKYLYMTTGHGRPDGKLWKAAPRETRVGEASPRKAAPIAMPRGVATQEAPPPTAGPRIAAPWQAGPGKAAPRKAAPPKAMP